jgi:uncharacterized protein YegP (UPF0339 family)
MLQFQVKSLPSTCLGNCGYRYRARNACVVFHSELLQARRQALNSIVAEIAQKAASQYKGK